MRNVMLQADTHSSCASFLPLSRLLNTGRSANHSIAYGEKGLAIPWVEFASRVNAICDRLLSRTERFWALSCTDAYTFACAFLAVLHANKAVVIPPNFQPATLTALQGAFDGVIADHAMPAAAWPVLSVAEEYATTARVLPPLHEGAEIHLYTSGSSGEPKRIKKRLAQLDAEVAALESIWGAGLGMASVVSTVPHHHIYGLLFRLLWPLAAGRPFDTVTCAEPQMLGERLSGLNPSLLVSSPALLARLPELIELDKLRPWPRMIFSSGGPLPRATALLFATSGGTPIEVYGSTETGGIAWRCQQQDDDSWIPLPDVRINSTRNGALSISSHFLGTTSSHVTADAAEILENGRFRLLGRLDRVVKIEEKRLSLPEMENRLRQHAWVADAAIVPLPPPARLGAVIALNKAGNKEFAIRGKRAVQATLREYLAERFETVLLPRSWRFPAELPLSDRGKISHAGLRRLFEEGQTGSAT